MKADDGVIKRVISVDLHRKIGIAFAVSANQTEQCVSARTISASSDVLRSDNNDLKNLISDEELCATRLIVLTFKISSNLLPSLKLITMTPDSK